MVECKCLNKLLVVQIKRLYLLLTVKESAMDIPLNLEARRRIAFFTNSLFMSMPRAPPVCDMLSFRYDGLKIYYDVWHLWNSKIFLSLNCIVSVVLGKYQDY